MSEPRPLSETDRSLMSGTVLYIEDSQVNYEAVRACLSGHPQLMLLHSTTGHGGVARTMAELPEVILLDMHLPDISGVEVLRLLSEIISARGIRVILLTSDKLNIDVLKAMSLGAFIYLAKPADPEKLEAAIRRALAQPRASN